MACLSERRRAIWRSRLSKEPLPKGLVREEWKASVGNSRLRWCSQRLVTQAGTCRGGCRQWQACQHAEVCGCGSVWRWA
jgi:hypothetical protein